MNTAAQYFHLLRWLAFPSIIFAIIMAVVIAGAGVTLWLFLTVDPLVGKVFYSIPVFFYIFLLFNFQTRFALLFARKTMTLTGVLAWRLTVIGFVLMTLWSLAITPALVGLDNLASWTSWWRATVLTLSFITLLLYIGALTRLNLFFVGLVILAVTLWDADAFSAIATTAWREGSAATYGALFLLTLALWAALYLRIARSRMPNPLGGGPSQGDSDNNQSLPAETNLIARCMPRLQLGKHLRSPESLLLQEFTRPVLAAFLQTLAGGLPLVLILALALYLAASDDFLSLAAWAVIFVPLFTSVDAMAGNTRRLWLLLPGGRAEILKQVERAYARSLGPGLMVFLALSIALMADQRPLWWLVCWAALMPITAALFFYMHFLTVAWDHPLQPVVRFLIGMVLIAPSIGVFWFETWPLFSAGLLASLLVSALVARQLGRKRWLRMDYSLLGKKVAQA